MPVPHATSRLNEINSYKSIFITAHLNVTYSLNYEADLNLWTKISIHGIQRDVHLYVYINCTKQALTLERKL